MTERTPMTDDLKKRLRELKPMAVREVTSARIGELERDLAEANRRLAEIAEIAAVPRPSYDMERCLKSIATLATPTKDTRS